MAASRPWRTLLLAPLLLAVAACVSMPQEPQAPPQVPIAKLREQGQAAIGRGDMSAALLAYQSLLERDPDDTDALYRVGELQAQAGYPAPAEAYFDKVLTARPGDAAALEARGIERLRQRKYLAAQEDLTAAIGQDPKRWRALNALGVLADLGGRWSEAQGYYRRALAILPDAPELLNNLGFSLMSARDYAAAEDILRKAMRAAPQSQRIANDLGMSIAWQGRYLEAVETASPVLGAAMAYNNVGYVALLRRDRVTAAAYFRKAIDLSPTYYVTAQRNLARVLATDSDPR